MSMSGERLVIGARFGDVPGIPPISNCGVAWVWTLGSDDLWANEVRIDAGATDAATNDSFGWSVGMDDDLVIAGSPFDTHSSQTNAGSAYVFVDSSGWSQEQKLIASDAAPSDNFGYSVAIDGDLAVVGAPFDNISTAADAGSAYVFRRSGTSWSQEAKLTAPTSNGDKNFGQAVAISGNTIIVGEPDSDSSPTGRAYVFVYSSTWSHQATLAPTTTGDDHFGTSVAIQGDVAVVGDPSSFRRAYVFSRDGTTWLSPTVVQGCDTEVGNDFGKSVEIGTDRIVVGAPGVDTGAGAAYVFDLEDDEWTEVAKLFACDGAEGYLFGSAVTIDGRIVAVGAPENDEAATSQGQSYNYSGVAPCRCEGDLNGSGTVTGTDLAILLSAWGACSNCSSCPEDIDGNCVVGGTDLGLLLGDWGRCPGAEGCPESFMGGSSGGEGEGEGELTEDEVAALLGFSDAASFYDWIQSADTDDVQAAGLTLQELMGG
jgi:hypothetical protein